MRRDLSADLRQLGFEVGPGGMPMQVTVHSWGYDGFHSGLLDYDVEGVVTDAGGAERISTHVLHTQMLPDARTRDSRATALELLPGIYDTLVNELLRDNASVLRALTGP